MAEPSRSGPRRCIVATLDDIFREEWGRVLAALIGVLGDFDLAEEAAQEAFPDERRTTFSRSPTATGGW
jgi:hypothetical protein